MGEAKRKAELRASLRFGDGSDDDLGAAFIAAARRVAGGGGTPNEVNLAIQMVADAFIREGANSSDVLVGINWGLGSCIVKSNSGASVPVDELLDAFRASLGLAVRDARAAYAAKRGWDA